ncbi:hypothetical protein L4Z97_002884 [Pseudomonas aeruginosa]
MHTPELLNPAIAQRLNTSSENLAQSFALDNDFWVSHGEDLEQRFITWAAK